MEEVVEYERIRNSGSSNDRRVGLIYDERMCKHFTPDGDFHYENPDRIKAIWKKLQTAGIPQRCVVLDAKEAEDKYIVSVHTKSHINLIRNISSSKFDSQRNRTASKFNSIYLNEGSSESAYLAAGSVIEVAERVAKGELNSAFAIVRPPGHHAEEDEPMGFCLYNNVAIATSFVLNDRTELGIKKILIVDWDVHHGNGTQKMFWKDPRVLFFSVHRHDFGSFYPANDDGFYTMIGEGAGAGYNINVPWENGHCGDPDYLAVWDHILIPVAKDFNPDLIIVSAGFDAAVGDPLGGCCVTPYGYSVMLHKLMEFAHGKIVMALEGGYNLDSLANSVLVCVEVLLENNSIIGSSEAYPFESTWRVIQMVRQQLSAFWPILADELPKKSTSCKAPSLNMTCDDGPLGVQNRKHLKSPSVEKDGEGNRKNIAEDTTRKKETADQNISTDQPREPTVTISTLQPIIIEETEETIQIKDNSPNRISSSVVDSLHEQHLPKDTLEEGEIAAANSPQHTSLRQQDDSIPLNSPELMSTTSMKQEDRETKTASETNPLDHSTPVQATAETHPSISTALITMKSLAPKPLQEVPLSQADIPSYSKHIMEPVSNMEMVANTEINTKFATIRNHVSALCADYGSILYKPIRDGHGHILPPPVVIPSHPEHDLAYKSFPHFLNAFPQKSVNFHLDPAVDIETRQKLCLAIFREFIHKVQELAVYHSSLPHGTLSLIAEELQVMKQKYGFSLETIETILDELIALKSCEKSINSSSEYIAYIQSRHVKNLQEKEQFEKKIVERRTLESEFTANIEAQKSEKRAIEELKAELARHEQQLKDLEHKAKILPKTILTNDQRICYITTTLEPKLDYDETQLRKEEQQLAILRQQRQAAVNKLKLMGFDVDMKDVVQMI